MNTEKGWEKDKDRKWIVKHDTQRYNLQNKIESKETKKPNHDSFVTHLTLKIWTHLCIAISMVGSRFGGFAVS